MSGWGSSNNYWNSPLVTVIPRLTLPANANQSLIVTFKNGLALAEESGHVLSGAEPFSVTWTGVLLVDCGGCYHLAMGCPQHTDNDSSCHCEKFKQWSVTLQRGQKTWHLLQNEPKEGGLVPKSHSKPVTLRRGAYDIVIEFSQPEPNFDDTDDLRKFHTGFVLNYTGPDTKDCLVEIPIKNLYIGKKDGIFGWWVYTTG